MAEEYCGGANWWDRASGAAGGSSATSSSTANYGWLTDPAPTASPLDPAAPASSPLQLVGLGLSSQAVAAAAADWSHHHQQQQPLLSGNPEKVENSFRSMLQEGMGLSSGSIQQDFTQQQQQLQWREKIGRGFSLDESCSSMESTVTCQGLNPPAASGFQLDSPASSSVYGSPSSILQGFIGSTSSSDHHHNNQQNPQLITSNYTANYHHQQHQQQQQQQQQNFFGGMVGISHVPQFLRGASPPKPPPPPAQHQQQQLHFANNAPYWNASAPAGGMADVSRPSFFASLQNQIPMPPFEEKPKLEEREGGTAAAKKSGQESTAKRARSEGTSSTTLPPFKVRKEKMGDRITALQQLVSPFGKTDTASVLSEAIEYIKFLHEQVSVLSTPYLKSGSASYQQNQSGNDKMKTDPDGPKQDLRSRGLCLVPVSSTFPMTHETTVDFWTPTFGGTFR